jgi:hypothetical protein
MVGVSGSLLSTSIQTNHLNKKPLQATKPGAVNNLMQSTEHREGDNEDIYDQRVNYDSPNNITL